MMRSIFKVDGKFYTFCSRLTDMVVLSFLWAVSCIPVVTAVPASASLNYSVQKCVKHEQGRAPAVYIQTMKQQLRKGAACGAVLMPALIVLAAGMFFLVRSAGNNAALFFVTMMGLLLLVLSTVVCWTGLLLPLDGEIRGNPVQFAFVAALRNFPRSLLMLAAAGAGMLAVYVSPPLALVVPSLISLLSLRIAGPVIDRYFPDNLYNIKE